MKTLAQITAAVEANPKLRHDLGRSSMWEACSACTLAVCNSASGACLARQEKSRRCRAYYARSRVRRRRQARAYYLANQADHRAKSAAYQRDPGNLEAMAVKRRVRYALKRKAEGREVRAYRWVDPQKNKPARPAKEPS